MGVGNPSGKKRNNYLITVLHFDFDESCNSNGKFCVYQLTPRWVRGWSGWRFCIQTAQHQVWLLSPRRCSPPACPRPLPPAAQTSPSRGLSGPGEEQEDGIYSQNLHVFMSFQSWPDFWCDHVIKLNLCGVQGHYIRFYWCVMYNMVIKATKEHKHTKK